MKFITFYPCDYIPGLYLHHGPWQPNIAFVIIYMHLYHIVSLASPWTATYLPATIQCQVQKIDGWENSDDLFASMTMDQVRELQWAWWHDELLGRPNKNGRAALPKVSGCLKLMHQESIGSNLGSYVTRGLVPPMPNPWVSRSCSCYVLDMVRGMSQWWFSHIRGFGHAQPSHSRPGYVAGHVPTVSGLSVLQECFGCPGSAAEFTMNHLLCSENWWADIDITSSQA